MLCIQSSPTRNEFCHVRDYILISIILENVSQPDSISNAAIKELQKSKMWWNGLCIFVAVNHKPVPTVGPTMLSRTLDLMLHLEKLIKIKKILLEVYKLVRRTQYLWAGLVKKWIHPWWQLNSINSGKRPQIKICI